jgi:hypothetical protein
MLTADAKSTSPDQCDDFHLISVGEKDSAKFAARQQPLIQFYRETLGLQFQLGKQIANGLLRGDFPRFAVQNYRHARQFQYGVSWIFSRPLRVDSDWKTVLSICLEIVFVLPSTNPKATTSPWLLP